MGKIQEAGSGVMFCGAKLGSVSFFLLHDEILLKKVKVYEM